MREMLAVALARQIGNVLTPELAKTIAREAASTPNLSIDPGQFEPVTHGAFVFQCERLVQAEQDLRAQRAQFLSEANGGAPMQTDWARLRELSRDGRQVIFTVREAVTGHLVGSVWLLVGENIDTRLSSVTDDLLYVEPAHRDLLLGVRLVQYAERCIFSMGVRSASFHFRNENGAGRMARFLGYQEFSTKYVKVAQDACDFSDVPTRHRKGVRNGSAA